MDIRIYGTKQTHQGMICLERRSYLTEDNSRRFKVCVSCCGKIIEESPELNTSMSVWSYMTSLSEKYQIDRLDD